MTRACRLQCLPTSRVRSLDIRPAAPPRAPKVTLGFYRSPEWKRLIASIIRKRGRRCEDCGATGCRVYGDHIQEIADGGALLDEGNVRLRCGACHNRKTAEERAVRGDIAGLLHPEGLKPSVVPLVIVCGPPAAGKSSYVREHAGSADMVIDLDEIVAAQTGVTTRRAPSAAYLARALAERNRLLGQLSDAPARWPAAWLIITEPTARWREWWQQALRPSRMIVIETPEDICHQRIAAAADRAPVRAQQSEAAAKWWNVYSRRPGEEIIPSGSPCANL